MELPIVERFPNWLRWLIVLPVAIAAYLVVQLVNVFAPAPAWVIRWFSSFANPFAFVLVGSLAAPKARFAVSLALATLISVSQGLIAAIATTRGAESLWSIWGSVIIGVVSAGVAAATIGEQQNQQQINRNAWVPMLRALARQIAAEGEGNRSVASEDDEESEDVHRHRAYYTAVVGSARYRQLFREYAEAPIDYEPVRDRLSRADREDLFRAIHRSGALSVEDKVVADFGMMAVLDGSPPSAEALSHLTAVFGPEFAPRLRASRTPEESRAKKAPPSAG